jgi:hypothetical protein
MEAEIKTPNGTPKVSKTEVETWEEKFRKNVSPIVQFYEQDNGYSMKFYNGQSGIVAFWSGIIKFKGEDYLKWEFDSLAGVKIDSKMNLDENNQKIPSNLYDFFKSWQAEILKTITKPSENQGGAVSQPEQTPDLAGPESANAPQAPEDTGMTPLAEGSLISNKPISKNNNSRVDNSRKNNIMDSAERMRRLAGL